MSSVNIPRGTKFFGKVCLRHPELRGERYLTKNDCVACVKTRRFFNSPEYTGLQARVAELELLASLRLQEIERLRNGLTRLASHECGCVPCRGTCKNSEELDERIAYAQELLEGCK